MRHRMDYNRLVGISPGRDINRGVNVGVHCFAADAAKEQALRPSVGLGDMAAGRAGGPRREK